MSKPVVILRMPQPMIEELDQLDENKCLTRAEKIRLAVAQYIQQRKQQEADAA